MLASGKTILVALGGNALIKARDKGTYKEQHKNLQRTSEYLQGLITSENRILITHGNGPQVGNLLLASELAKEKVPPMSLDMCVAATEGFMGSMIQQTLANSLRHAGKRHNITTVITQVIVAADDIAFEHPTKPIGPIYGYSEMLNLRREKGWYMAQDTMGGYRRLVPSPKPIKIQQARIIKSMLSDGEIVIAVGGGGVPLVRGQNGDLYAVEAVIDKDYASSLLATEIEADLFVILTGVEKVCKNYGLSKQEYLDELSINEARRLLNDRQFGEGSMKPKIEAAIEFLENKGKSNTLITIQRKTEVIITSPEKVVDAIQGQTGTRIVA
jgi:carbamate kinase